MRSLLKLVLLVSSMAWCSSLHAELTPAEILREADRARGNMDGVIWTVDVTSIAGGETNRAAFSVKARAHNFLAETLSPARRKGNILLMRKGNMWFYKPDLSKAVPIAQRQKLMGKAAYGDIAATNYSEDYDAHPLPDQVVNGKDCYVFDLRVRVKKATYDRITYWVEKERLVGIRAEYCTDAGKRFKLATIQYDHLVVTEGGEQRPFCSQVVIEDELLSSDTTSLVLTAPLLQPVPYSVFDLNLLAK